MFICITVSTRHNLTPKQSVKADPCSGLGLHFKKKNASDLRSDQGLLWVYSGSVLGVGFMHKS